MANDAPYFRTIPSSPEQDDENEIVLTAEDFIGIDQEGQEKEMVKPVKDTNDRPSASEQSGSSAAKLGKEQRNETEDEEEARLRRRLLEKKREKEQREKGRIEKQQQQKSKLKHKEQQKRVSPNPEEEVPVKREKIVWNRNEQKSASQRERIVDEESGRVDKKRQQREHEEQKKSSTEIGQRKRDNDRIPPVPAPSSTSINLKHTEEQKLDGKYGRAVDKSQKSISADLPHHHRKHREEAEKDRNRREDSRKRPRDRERGESNSSAETSNERKVARKEEETEPRKHHHPNKNETEEQKEVEEVETMEEVSPELGEEPKNEAELMEELNVEEKNTAEKKPKKYSKFESSPEMSDEEEGKANLGDKQQQQQPTKTIIMRAKTAIQPGELYSSDEDEQSEFGMDEEQRGVAANEEDDMENDGIIDDNFLENKQFDQLTEEEKAILSPEELKQMEERYQKKLITQLPIYYPGISGCRSVVEYECLNKISEGTFGVVYRAQERRTDEIVALKRLKMEKEHQGFPITSLREINMLLKCGTHPNVLNVREVVVGSSMDKIYMVMEYVEHDVKSLMELMKSRNKKWTIAQTKTLLRQLLSGIEHLHDEYVIHRDLKTSNLLLSHRGILKIADFGLAREFGEPIKPYTPIVVTLWYRSPELLLGTKVYSTPVDMWSVGCIFGEFLKLDPLFPGRTENDQLQKIFKEVGTPNEQIWPGCMDLPGMRTYVFADIPYNQLRRKFAAELSDDDGYELLNKLLALDPCKRLSATQALKSKWFLNDPKPALSSSFPTWPAKSEHNKKPPNEPVAPKKPVGGFTLKFDAPKF